MLFWIELRYTWEIYPLRILKSIHPMLITLKHFLRRTCLVVSTAIVISSSSGVHALDLIPDIFQKPKIIKPIWKLQEQYVALTTQGSKAAIYPANSHPVTLESDDIQDALKSLELWDKGGFFRNEDSHPVFTPAQAEMLGRFLSEALLKAKPNEDAIFTIRGYGSVAFDTFKDREWTSGRVFYTDGKLNLIIGTFKLQKDRGVRNAEAAHGVMENYADLYFDPGSRDKRTGKMPGRIVAGAGISYRGGKDDDARPDWVVIDIAAAALAYREGQIPEEQQQTSEKNKQEAAKLTIERRQMREEMARLRQQIKELHGGTSVGAKSLEDRLATLQALRDKKLITDEEYHQRRDKILKDI